MKRLAILAVAIAGAAALALPAAGITDGTLDGQGHPYVGLMVAQDAGGTPSWRCSGTMVSPTVFLTAGHCTAADGGGDVAHAEIFFDTGPITVDPNYTSIGSGGTGCANPAVTGYPCHGNAGGKPYTHPDFNPAAFYLYDLGVVELGQEDAVDLTEYGALPQLNQLDTLKTERSTTFTSVGYGLQRAFPVAAAWKDEAVRVRMVAQPRLIQINTPGSTGDFSMILSNNANTGGTCFGDSGGPNFLGTSNVVAAVTSYGKNPTCAGQGGVYRVDRADDLEWLATFGVAPASSGIDSKGRQNVHQAPLPPALRAIREEKRPVARGFDGQTPTRPAASPAAGVAPPARGSRDDSAVVAAAVCGAMGHLGPIDRGNSSLAVDRAQYATPTPLSAARFCSSAR